MFLRKRVASAAFALALGTSGAGATTIYVRAAASGANNGTSWANAFTSLQSALAAAASPDEIWVAAGTYKPTATTDRTISFALKNGVGIYGGFAGTETMRSQRNPTTNPTILSGDIGAGGVTTDNSLHVVTSDSSVSASGILDGFTVTGGHADGPGDPANEGGGAYVNQGSPTFAQVIFSNNYAGNRGGAVRVTGGSPSFTNSGFQNNVAGSAGGGLSAASVGSLEIRSCEFRNNIGQVGGSGGAIDATDNVTLVNSVIAQNAYTGVLLAGPNNRIINSTLNYNWISVTFLAGGNQIVNSIVLGVSLGPNGDVSVTYSCVPGGFVGEGNNDNYPTFVNEPDDFRLAAGSTGIDAGNNAAVPLGVTTDIAGQPRFFDDPGAANKGAGKTPIVDMGAHERVPLSISETRLFTLTACRAVDTRDPAGPYGGPALSAGKERTFVMANRCGIPISARALSLNVTVTQPGTPGHLLLYPSFTSAPLASTINFRAGQTRANNAIVPLGTGGTLAVQSAAPTHLIIDVNGYFE